jgi:hypothetical protein
MPPMTVIMRPSSHRIARPYVDAKFLLLIPIASLDRLNLRIVVVQGKTRLELSVEIARGFDPFLSQEQAADKKPHPTSDAADDFGVCDALPGCYRKALRRLARSGGGANVYRRPERRWERKPRATSGSRSERAVSCVTPWLVACVWKV